jgi:arabinogalactan endo-1,4-beta-galactosidase
MVNKRGERRFLKQLLRVNVVLALAIFGIATCIFRASADSIRVSPDLVGLPQFMTGGDISELGREEQLGAVYKDGNVPGDALLMFKKRGCNIMRLRLWVNPTDRAEYINDLPYTIALGRQIKKDGFLLLLDIHYSDSWADPGQQHIPEAWLDFSLPDLIKEVHDYSRDVIAAMRKGGAMPDIVEVGNEINNGLLWPIGKVEEPDGWSHLNALLKSGIQGVHDGSPSGRSPKIMIHTANGALDGVTRWFYDNLESPSNGGRSISTSWASVITLTIRNRLMISRLRCWRPSIGITSRFSSLRQHTHPSEIRPTLTI